MSSSFIFIFMWFIDIFYDILKCQILHLRPLQEFQWFQYNSWNAKNLDLYDMYWDLCTNQVIRTYNCYSRDHVTFNFRCCLSSSSCNSFLCCFSTSIFMVPHTSRALCTYNHTQNSQHIKCLNHLPFLNIRF